MRTSALVYTLYFIKNSGHASWQKIKLKKVLVGKTKTPNMKSKIKMKRIGNIFQQVISIENLMIADELARIGKSKCRGVLAHDKNREQNILKLHDLLKSKTYKTSAYEDFTIMEKKERLISRLPYYPDRIVHHAIINICAPLWGKIYTKDTHACIRGEGTHGAYRRIKAAMRDKEGSRFCLKIDIRKFYPSIDHEILKAIIRKKIKDEDLLWLLDEIIDSHSGLPIGNYTSQYFANLYLSYFDHYVKEVLGVKYYDRYADDIVFFASSKDILHGILESVKAYLKNNLSLMLNDNYQIFPVADTHKDRRGRGVDYVGYVFYHSEIRIRKYIKKNLCRKAAKINQYNLDYRHYVAKICGWLGYIKYTKSNSLLMKIVDSRHYKQIYKKLWKK